MVALKRMGDLHSMYLSTRTVTGPLGLSDHLVVAYRGSALACDLQVKLLVAAGQSNTPFEAPLRDMPLFAVCCRRPVAQLVRRRGRAVATNHAMHQWVLTCTCVRSQLDYAAHEGRLSHCLGVLIGVFYERAPNNKLHRQCYCGEHIEKRTYM
jgi:hypothetical protein